MPADDRYDVVHELVRKTGHHEHCWNNRAEKLPGYWCQDGWHEHRPITMGAEPPLRTPRWVWVESLPSAFECKQPGRGFPPLPGCIGCKDLRSYE